MSDTPDTLGEEYRRRFGVTRCSKCGRDFDTMIGAPIVDLCILCDAYNWGYALGVERERRIREAIVSCK